MLLSEALKMAEEINNELIAREEAAREREAGEPDYPAFDTAKPTDAERIATLEARVAALEAERKAATVSLPDDMRWSFSSPSWCERCQTVTKDTFSILRRMQGEKVMSVSTSKHCAVCSKRKK